MTSYDCKQYNRCKNPSKDSACYFISKIFYSRLSLTLSTISYNKSKSKGYKIEDHNDDVSEKISEVSQENDNENSAPKSLWH